MSPEPAPTPAPEPAPAPTPPASIGDLLEAFQLRPVGWNGANGSRHVKVIKNNPGRAQLTRAVKFLLGSAGRVWPPSREQRTWCLGLDLHPGRQILASGADPIEAFANLMRTTLASLPPETATNAPA